MPIDRRARRRWLVVLLAVPVIVLAYLAYAAGRLFGIGRAIAAAVLGATVIGAVYADEAWRHTPAPARRAPLPTALAAAIALALVGAGLPGAQAQAASPAEAVIQAARAHVGKPYVLGAEGPDAFDCSGLVYRAFRQAGEVPLIGGGRATAKRYFRWFATRGLADPNDGVRGDLVIYGEGKHIGIYLGKGRVLSAVAEGVKVHRLHALRNPFTTFLKVPWGGAPAPERGKEKVRDKDRDKDRGTDGAGGQDGATGDDGDDGDGSGSTSGAGGDAAGQGSDGQAGDGRDSLAGLPTGYAFGSLNVREAADPRSRIISWVTRGSTFTILDTGQSPSGALWLLVEKSNGTQGWIWARWTRLTEGSLENLDR